MNTFNSLKCAAVLLPALAMGIPVANAGDEDCDCPCDKEQTTAMMGADRDQQRADRHVSTTPPDQSEEYGSNDNEWAEDDANADDWNENESDAAATATVGSQYLANKPASGFHSDSLIGREITNRSNDESVGEISNLVLDENGQVVAVIVSVGGVMGLGEREVAIAWDQIEREVDGEETNLFINLTNSSLKDAPKYKNKEAEYTDQ